MYDLRENQKRQRTAVAPRRFATRIDMPNMLLPLPSGFRLHQGFGGQASVRRYPYFLKEEF
jgi:hypothetical protein